MRYSGDSLFNKQHAFITETVTERDYLYPEKTKEKIKAVKISGLKNPMFVLIASQFQSFSFYKDYMRKYNMSYKHKYEIMYNDFFFFLSLLPDTDYKYINYDINFYKNVITNNNSVFRNDIDFLYRLYRIFFIKYFTICIFDFSLHKQSERLSNVLLMQGPSFIKSLFDIKFCKKQS